MQTIIRTAMKWDNMMSDVILTAEITMNIRMINKNVNTYADDTRRLWTFLLAHWHIFLS